MLAGSQSRTTMTDNPPEDRYQIHMGKGWYTSEDGLVKFVNRNDANGYYKAFSLSPDATRDEIKAAYRRLVKTLHPDRDGDEEMFRFVAEIANVLLNEDTKTVYDSVSGNDAIYLGNMEREELSRAGFLRKQREESLSGEPHWACLTTYGFPPGKDTDEWIDLCWEASRAVGYRGKIRVGVLEGGQYWPGDPTIPWGILNTGQYVFVVFQRGVEPNRLHALCAMIDWQSYLLKQIKWGSPHDRERT